MDMRVRTCSRAASWVAAVALAAGLAPAALAAEPAGRAVDNGDAVVPEGASVPGASSLVDAVADASGGDGGASLGATADGVLGAEDGTVADIPAGEAPAGEALAPEPVELAPAEPGTAPEAVSANAPADAASDAPVATAADAPVDAAAEAPVAAIADLPATSGQTLFEPDEGSADLTNNVTIGMPGRYETSGARALIDRVNQIRQEAYQLGLTDSYTPIIWSGSLEYAAQVRAAEAAFGGWTLAHDRPSGNGNDCFTTEHSGNWEILAWGGDMSSGLEMWYSEKDDYIRHVNGDTSIPLNSYGHYEALIEAKYIGMSSFADAGSGAVAQAGELAGEGWGATEGTDEPLAGDQDVVRQIHVNRQYLVASLYDANVTEGGSAKLSLTLASTIGYGYYGDTSPVTWSSSNEGVVSVDGSGVVTGRAPGSVTVTATLGDWTLGSATVTVTRYSDTPAGAWYMTEGWIDAISDIGIMGGFSDGTFQPEGPLTRAQVATMLYRLGTGATGNAPAPGRVSFSDTGEHWAAGAIEWCYEKGIVTGYSDGHFAPDATVTRQELATMVWRYVGAPAASDDAAYLRTADHGSEYPFATEALKWCAAEGVLSGNVQGDGSLMIKPAETASRAQGAKMFTVLYRDVLGR